MPSGPDTPEGLRSRAIALRKVASKLDNAAALDLHQRAGVDVWEGPTPRTCHDELLDVRRNVLKAAQDLRSNARVLEDRAAQLTPTPVSSAR